MPRQGGTRCRLRGSPRLVSAPHRREKRQAGGIGGDVRSGDGSSRRRGGSDVGLDVGGGAFDEVPAADVGHQGGVRARGRDVGEVERVSGAAQAGQGGADQGSPKSPAARRSVAPRARGGDSGRTRRRRRRQGRLVRVNGPCPRRCVYAGKRRVHDHRTSRPEPQCEPGYRLRPRGPRRRDRMRI